MFKYLFYKSKSKYNLINIINLDKYYDNYLAPIYVILFYIYLIKNIYNNKDKIINLINLYKYYPNNLI